MHIKQHAILKAYYKAGETECKPGYRVMYVQLREDVSFIQLSNFIA